MKTKEAVLIVSLHFLVLRGRKKRVPPHGHFWPIWKKRRHHFWWCESQCLQYNPVWSRSGSMCCLL